MNKNNFETVDYCKSLNICSEFLLCTDFKLFQINNSLDLLFSKPLVAVFCIASYNHTITCKRIQFLFKIWLFEISLYKFIANYFIRFNITFQQF